MWVHHVYQEHEQTNVIQTGLLASLYDVKYRLPSESILNPSIITLQKEQFTLKGFAKSPEKAPDTLVSHTDIQSLKLRCNFVQHCS